MSQSMMIYLYMIGLCVNFTMWIRTHSVLKRQFLQVTGFHGFLSIVFSVPDSNVSYRIWYFPVMGVKRKERGDCMFLKKGRMKKERGGLIQLSALCCNDEICPNHREIYGLNRLLLYKYRHSFNFKLNFSKGFSFKKETWCELRRVKS